MGRRNVDCDNVLAIANDDEADDAIDTVHGTFELASPPSANAPALLAVVSEDRIINKPSPLPAPWGRGIFVLDMMPNGDAHLKSQVSQSIEPGSFRQRAE